jgi:hypothetical protein
MCVCRLLGVIWLSYRFAGSTGQRTCPERSPTGRTGGRSTRRRRRRAAAAAPPPPEAPQRQRWRWARCTASAPSSSGGRGRRVSAIRVSTKHLGLSQLRRGFGLQSAAPLSMPYMPYVDASVEWFTQLGLAVGVTRWFRRPPTGHVPRGGHLRPSQARQDGTAANQPRGPAGSS